MWNVYLDSLVVMLVLGFATWLYSLYKRDVSIVDSLWSIMFLAASIYVVSAAPETTWRTGLLLFMVAVWALRLSIFLTIRNWGEPEDRRYQQIRANNSPNFGFKSLFIIFTLQAVIAWVVFLGLLPALYNPTASIPLDVIAVGIWAAGVLIESAADYQLYAFSRKASNRGKVLDSGVWRYTRHPNYFGEFLVWWGFFLIAAGSGYWWAIIAPLVMTLLLLKVSGVGLMEKGIESRRPGYKDYAERTNTFFPWFPKTHANGKLEAINHD